MASRTTRITVTLPDDLLARVEQAVRASKARDRNAFIVAAIRRELFAIEEAEIDASFAFMAEDTEYQALSDILAAEFATAEWEAFLLSESPDPPPC